MNEVFFKKKKVDKLSILKKSLCTNFKYKKQFLTRSKKKKKVLHV